MSNVKEFPAKSSPINDIAERLKKLGPKTRTLMVIGRDEDGKDVFVMCHVKDSSHPEDMLVIQRVVQEVVDSVWSGALDSDEEG